jgi:hypothetical protein
MSIGTPLASFARTNRESVEDGSTRDALHIISECWSKSPEAKLELAGVLNKDMEETRRNISFLE